MNKFRAYLVNKKKGDWPSKLPDVLGTTRTTLSTAKRFAPAPLVLVRDITTPLSVKMHDVPPINKKDLETEGWGRRREYEAFRGQKGTKNARGALPENRGKQSD